jgi:hypothetical protein
MIFEAILKIIPVIFFLLPGYLLISIQRFIKEYFEEDNFNLTIRSLFFSFLVFSKFIVMLLISIGSNETRKMFLILASIFEKNSAGIISSIDLNIIFLAIVYILSFLNVCVAIFIWTWQEIGYKIITNLIGFTSKTNKLTPWDELLLLSLNKYTNVTTKNGEIILGKISYISHLPYDKEIIIGKQGIFPIQVQDTEFNNIKIEGDLEYVYLNEKEIASIQIINTGISDSEDLQESISNQGWILTYKSIFITWFSKKISQNKTLILVGLYFTSLYLITHFIGSIRTLFLEETSLDNKFLSLSFLYLYLFTNLNIFKIAKN